MTHDPVQNPYTSPNTVPTDPLSIRSSSETNMLISLALVIGIVIISGIMLFLVVSKANNFSELLAVDPDDYLFLAIGFGLCWAGAVLSFVIRLFYKQRAARQFLAEHNDVRMPSDTESVPGSLLGMYATVNIAGGALLEGPAVVNAIFILICDNLWHLIPVVVAIVGILVTLPTASRTRQFVEEAIGRS